MSFSSRGAWLNLQRRVMNPEQSRYSYTSKTNPNPAKTTCWEDQILTEDASLGSPCVSCYQLSTIVPGKQIFNTQFKKIGLPNNISISLRTYSEAVWPWLTIFQQHLLSPSWTEIWHGGLAGSALEFPAMENLQALARARQQVTRLSTVHILKNG